MKSRYLKSIITALLLAVTSITAFGREITVDGVVYYLYEYDYTATANGSSSKGRVVIPEQVSDGVNTYTVTQISSFTARPITEVVIPGTVTNIGGGAFQNCIGLTSVELQYGVEEISYQAFGGCSSLVNLRLPTSLKIINSDGFSGCKSLREVEISESVTKIGPWAFYGCDNLEKVTLPESLSMLSEGVFINCTALRSITIPSKIEIILDRTFESTSIQDVIFKGADVMVGINAFPSDVQRIAYPAGSTRPQHLDNALAVEFPADAVVEDGFIYSADRSELLYAPVALSGAFDVPEGVRAIGPRAFARCSQLTSLSLPSTLESIGEECFSDCVSLTGTINVPEGVRAIGPQAFARCSQLTSVSLPSTLESIGEECFYDCVSLTNPIDVPEGVRAIGPRAFARCSQLTSVSLPSTLESIGEECFSGCSSLADVAVGCNVPPTVAASTFDESHFSAVRLSVPYTGFAAYNAHDVWGRFVNKTATGGAFVNKITLSATYLIFPPGQFRELTATVEPADATVNTVAWSSSNEAVARVVGGMVLGIADGEAIITATATDGSGVTASCRVVIGQPVLVERLEAYEEVVELQRMQKEYLNGNWCYVSSFNVYPSNATDKRYKISSSDTTVVAVFSEYFKKESGYHGFVTLKAGEAIITATALDGSGVTGSYKVIVKPLPKGDSNFSYSVDIADAMMTANYAVGRPVSEDFDFEAADVDEDGEVTVADAVGTVSIILGEDGEAASAPRREPETAPAEPDRPELYLSQPHAIASSSVGYWTDIALLNKSEYYGLQTTILLPEGMSFVTNSAGNPYFELNDRCDSTFSYVYNLVSPRELRVALFSTAHHAITAQDGNVFHVGINVSPGYYAGEVRLVNTRLVDAADRAISLDDFVTPFEHGGYTIYTTAIRCAREQSTTVPLRLASWYSLSGIQVDITPSEGLSIDPASVRPSSLCAASHQVWARQTAEGSVRVVCMSMAGDLFDTSVLYGPVLEFDLKASPDAPDDGRVDFTNITIIDSQADYDRLRNYSHSVVIIDSPSGVDAAVADGSEATIAVNGCEVTVSGLEDGVPAMAYDMQGRLVTSTAATHSCAALTLPQSGYYVVTVPGRSWKIAVR